MILPFYILLNDLKQMLRDRKTFLFFLLMPIAFTLLFGFIFNNQDQGGKDERLPVGILNQDGAAPYGRNLADLLAQSGVIRLEEQPDATALEKKLRAGDLAAGLVIPAGYGAALRSGAPLPLIVSGDAAASAGLSARAEITTAAARLARAALAARALSAGDAAAFDAAFAAALAAWDNPPVRLLETSTSAAQSPSRPAAAPAAANGFAHSSPGMILQFAIAGLLTCAGVIIAERKNGCFQRLQTTAVGRARILTGHYLAVLSLVLCQFVLLILFGQLALGLNYFGQAASTLLVAVSAAACIAALGLLIGVMARSEEQAISYALICMFLLAALGGAWVPLEVTGPAFQRVGHLSPVAWAMDGFANVLLRGLPLSANLLPAGVLLAYAALFLGLSFWRLKVD